MGDSNYVHTIDIEEAQLRHLISLLVAKLQASIANTIRNDFRGI